jgi:hypothetical protein
MFSIPSAWIADYLFMNEIASINIIRKSFAFVSQFGTGICLIGLSFTDCNQTKSVIWLCLAVMFSGANNAGINVSLEFFL